MRVLVLVLSRNMYSPHHILWYIEYETTDKYMIRLSNRFRRRNTNTFIYGSCLNEDQVRIPVLDCVEYSSSIITDQKEKSLSNGSQPQV